MVAPQPKPTSAKHRRLAMTIVFCLVIGTTLIVAGGPVRADTPPTPPFRGQTETRAYDMSPSATEKRRTSIGPSATRKTTQSKRTARARKAALTRRSASFVVSIGFQPELHGFAFANWSASTSDDDANLATARRLFGDASVCATVEAGTCSAFERVTPFLERLNAELDKGRCEGMVLLAFERFRSGSAGSSSLAKNDVVPELNYWSATQILPEARNRARDSRGWDLERLVAEIRADLQHGGGSVLGLYENDKAHSVLPVSIGIVDGLARVGLYDPNHPLVAQTLVIDLVARSWSYTSVYTDGSAATSWSGSAVGGLSFVPFVARGSTPVDYFKS